MLLFFRIEHKRIEHKRRKDIGTETMPACCKLPLHHDQSLILNNTPVYQTGIQEVPSHIPFYRACEAMTLKEEY